MKEQSTPPGIIKGINKKGSVITYIGTEYDYPLWYKQYFIDGYMQPHTIEVGRKRFSVGDMTEGGFEIEYFIWNETVDTWDAVFKSNTSKGLHERVCNINITHTKKSQPLSYKPITSTGDSITTNKTKHTMKQSTLVKDYTLEAALKAGWIQIGPGVPVFMKIDPPGKNVMTWADGSHPEDYCVRFVVPPDANAHYDIYNMWIENGTMKLEDLDIEKIFGISYTSVRCPISSLSIVAASSLDSFYLGNDVEKFRFYESIGTFLFNEAKSKKEKDGTNE